MRSTIGTASRYSANPVPENPNAEFFRAEFLAIESALTAILDGHIDASNVAPSKPRDGMLRRADGVNWNPGSGAGVYCFYNSAWHFLG